MATFYCTPAGAGDNSGDSWANAMAASDFYTSVASASAGDIYWVYSGTYTLTANLFLSSGGTEAAHVHVAGCEDQATPPTPATGDNRPLFIAGSYTFRYGDSFTLENVRVSCTNGDGAYAYSSSNISRNCKFMQSTSGQPAATCGGAGNIYEGCEFVPPSNHVGCEGSSSSAARFVGCLFNGGTYGLYVPGFYAVVIDCIFDTCSSYGIYLTTGNYATVINSNFYDCDKGIYVTNGAAPLVLNCTFTDSTTYGLDATGTDSLSDYNNFYNNGGDRNNWAVGDNDTSNDPEFTNAAGGDFSWASGGNLEGAGLGMGLGVGATAGTKDQGAWEIAAGGGGGGGGRCCIIGG